MKVVISIDGELKSKQAVNTLAEAVQKTIEQIQLADQTGSEPLAEEADPKQFDKSTPVKMNRKGNGNISREIEYLMSLHNACIEKGIKSYPNNWKRVIRAIDKAVIEYEHIYKPKTS